MANKQQVLAALRESGVIVVLRTENPVDLVAVAEALSKGGVKFIEITMTIPGALDIIKEAVARLKGVDVFIGAGTVLDAPTARAVILAGAHFVVGPVFDADMVKMCNSYSIVVMAGALTPTEIFNAWKGGCDVVKVFPGDVGGPDYLKAVKEPLPQVELLPTKGVDFETAAGFIKAGAIGVGTGGAVVPKAMMAAKDYAGITRNAEKMIRIVREARGGK